MVHMSNITFGLTACPVEEGGRYTGQHSTPVLNGGRKSQSRRGSLFQQRRKRSSGKVPISPYSNGCNRPWPSWNIPNYRWAFELLLRAFPRGAALGGEQELAPPERPLRQARLIPVCPLFKSGQSPPEPPVRHTAGPIQSSQGNIATFPQKLSQHVMSTGRFRF